MFQYYYVCILFYFAATTKRVIYVPEPVEAEYSLLVGNIAVTLICCVVALALVMDLLSVCSTVRILKNNIGISKA